jgi:hypothetical protein
MSIESGPADPDPGPSRATSHRLNMYQRGGEELRTP